MVALLELHARDVEVILTSTSDTPLGAPLLTTQHNRAVIRLPEVVQPDPSQGSIVATVDDDAITWQDAEWQ